MITDEQALNTSRLVLFEALGEEKYTYYGGGSALLFTWLDVGYVVTAKHVTKKAGQGKIRIALEDGSFQFFRFDNVFEPVGEESDWKDLAFFRVHPGLPRDQWVPHALPLDLTLLRAAANSYVPGQPLWLSGYPSCHQVLDYEASHIHYTRCFLKGWYDSPDSTAVAKHRVVIDAEIDSFEGLSGSPVFAQAEPQSLLFAGIFIQGSASSRVGHFVGAEALAAMLAQLPAAA